MDQQYSAIPVVKQTLDYIRCSNCPPRSAKVAKLFNLKAGALCASYLMHRSTAAVSSGLKLQCIRVNTFSGFVPFDIDAPTYFYRNG